MTSTVDSTPLNNLLINQLLVNVFLNFIRKFG